MPANTTATGTMALACNVRGNTPSCRVAEPGQPYPERLVISGDEGYPNHLSNCHG